MLSTNKVVYLCQVSKLQHMYAMGFTLRSVLKTTKHTISKISKKILGELSRGSF